MNGRSEGIIIFSGYNPRAVMAFCRVASRTRVPFAIIASSSRDLILRSKYAAQVAAIRRSPALSWAEVTQSLSQARAATGFVRCVILPSSEALNRFLLANRTALHDLGFEVPLVDEALYTAISDKHSFGELCRAHGIRVPGEIAFSEVERFPVVVKPRQYLMEPQSAPHIIQSEAELEAFQASHDPQRFYCQEFVGGSSYYLLFYFRKAGGRYCSFSQRNLVQQPGGKSVVAAVPANIHQETIAKTFANMFLSLGFWGLVMVEVKFSQGEYFMIEANPRLWGPSQLFVDNGVPLFEHLIADLHLGVELDLDPLGDGAEHPYFWFGGLLQAAEAGGQVTYHEFSEDRLVEQMAHLMANDVYLRGDSLGVFWEECKSSWR